MKVLGIVPRIPGALAIVLQDADSTASRPAPRSASRAIQTIVLIGKFMRSIQIVWRCRVQLVPTN
jgi:hypothetical protein